MNLKSTLKQGLKFLGVTENHRLVQQIRKKLEDPLIKKIRNDPLNPLLHMEKAERAAAKGNHYLAFAEFKTACHLGLDIEQPEQLEERYRLALPEKSTLNHNLYFRLKSLADEIQRRSNGSRCSVLDVGGGSGALASFIPEHSYCLVEPTVNGISGTDLPFADRSFDLVVSCHVLEHIHPDERKLFLNQLLSRAKTGLILLNPFEVPGTLPNERLRLVIDVTDAPWAKEHLDCSLPKIDDLKAYALERELKMDIRPNGTMTTSLAYVFLMHFAEMSSSKEAVSKINTFFNENYFEILDSPSFPNAYLVFIGAS